MLTKSTYGFKLDTSLPVEDAQVKVADALKEQGFGILTQIDVQATLTQKIEVDIDKYVILGVCNPYLAYDAILTDPDVGLLLPCNVILYEDEVTGRTVISIVDPVVSIQAFDDPDLAEIANDARECLEKAFAAIDL